ncbi:MAG: ATP-dependent helicase, RecQ family [Bryobacterales bacterium]|nr:ATP-dependent helicase, RecQ family [Bryobacterales bacterium]
MESVIAGRDTLAIFPTGAGKSAIYQITAVLLNGPTVVVSPLIALQKDQVETLAAQDVGGAAVVNSHTRAREKKDTLEELEAGGLEFFFVTPEQLANPKIMDSLREAKPSLFVVDEAHCVSEWGHDFRPDYLKLGAAIEALDHPTVLALTATASQPVRDEIIARLAMREPRVIVKGFDRPNIKLRVDHFQSEAEKKDALLHRVSWAEGSGIVYVSSRRHAEDLALEIPGATHYHGGMTAKERNPVQEAFMSGEVRVIVATSAFGMGIDKPDIRFIFHYDIPHSVDSYYQEIGRAGRDGEPAEAVLFFRSEDLNIHKFFAGGGKLDVKKVERVAEALEAKDAPVSVKDLAAETDLSRAKVTKAVQRLEDAGAVRQSPEGIVAVAENAEELREAAQIAVGESEQRHQAELFRIERMRAYAELRECRRAYLLHYFGEEAPESCGNCDNCG